MESRNKRIAVAFALCLIGALGIPCCKTSWAYYYVPKPVAEVRFAPNAGDVDSIRQSTHFVFYDNMDQDSTSLEREIALRPDSAFFVPADIIDGNMALYPLLSKRLSSERYLENFLYANMKLYLLLQEYKRVQEKALELVGNIGTPYFRAQNITVPQREIAAGVMDRNGVEGLNQKKDESINDALRSVKRETASMEFATGSISAGPAQEEKPQNSSSEGVIASSGASEIYRSGSIGHSDQLKRTGDISAKTDENRYKSRSNISDSVAEQNDFDTWIMNFMALVTGVLEYMATNKVETAIYFFLLYIWSFVILRALRK